MTLKELKNKSIEQNIPIMFDETLDYINRRIKLFNLNKILEIGTAVGYSSICIALNNDKVNITTIEKDAQRFMIATKNIREFNLNDRISLIFNDALTVDMKETYDLIIIDAAKGKNKQFFEKYKDNLNSGGFIIVDNIAFHGLVGKSETIESKNLRSMVKKIEEFLEFLKTQDDFIIEIVKDGDGLAVCQRKN